MLLHNEPEWLFPFESMSVGDSFFIPTLKTAPMIHAIESGAKRVKIRIKTCVVVEDKLMGVRTWRIA
jgi:beta-phosphoglucomutase-like phosphatase (HAD superfamily)